MVVDGMAGPQRFVFVQLQLFALVVGVFVKQGKNRKDSREPQTVNKHQDRSLLNLNHLFRPACSQSPSGELSYDEGKDKLQGINIKEHHKKQDRIQEHRIKSLQPGAARIDVMFIPNLDEQREANGKSRKALHGVYQFCKGL